jgi:hypothetical protein
MKPDLKTAWKNLPLSIPVPQADFFDELARLLGISRNAVLCLTLRIGGPIIFTHAQNIRRSVYESCEAISITLGKSSENVGAAQTIPLEAITAPNERRKSARKSRR